MGRTKLPFVAVACLSVAVLRLPYARAAEPPKGNSIESLADRLSGILQFRIEKGQLVLDRESWEEKAEVQRNAYREGMRRFIESNEAQEKANDARQQAVLAQQKAAYEQALSSPTLGFLISEIFSDLSRAEPPRVINGAMPMQLRMPRMMSRNQDRFSCWCETNAMRLTARIKNDSERIELIENNSPRAFCFSNHPVDGFRLEYTDGDRNLIVLQQHADSFGMIVIRDEKTICETSETFVAFVRGHRELVGKFVLPSLAKIGIFPMLPLESEEVRSEALEMLSVPKDSELTAERQKYNEYRKRITGLLNSTRLLGDRVKKVADFQKTQEWAHKTIDAFDLLKDPEYLVSLLDGAGERAQPILVARLEEVTGQKLGNDPEKWRAWVKESKPETPATSDRAR